jgi:hypothetical protein
MLKTIEKLKNVTVLNKAQQAKVGGGAVTCGLKVNGVWYHVIDGDGDGATKDDALGGLGTTFYNPNGTVAGTATNWCCASCPWN